MTDIIPTPALPSLPIEGDARRFPVRRIFCIGRNYAEHAKEMGAETDAIFFMKPADAISTARTIPYPPATTDLHHEVELVLALGDGGAIMGCGVGVDLTRRDLQGAMKARGAPWEIGKAFENSAPVGLLRFGPVPERGAISLKVNGVRRQSGDLSDMLLPPRRVLAALSRYFTLKPGDLIFTGTPAGVGPLQRDDRVTAEIDGLPTLEFSIS
ncbi:fumarylacetoacetate hydrolase family protein [Maricaulis sp.]|uniref:fumarylacetoacetate hydrolase family protein n=1 Tax=Maricaulis sp. TaxID=1486257 RepID=UPI003A8DAE5E